MEINRPDEGLVIVRAAILLAGWLAVMWWVFLDNDLVGGGFFVGAASAVVVPWLWRRVDRRRSVS